MRRTALLFVFLLTASMLTLSSCARLGNFTKLSNSDFRTGTKYVSKGIHTGTSTFAVWWLPFAREISNIESAYDDAIAKAGGGDIMTDVELDRIWWARFFFMIHRYLCRGEVWQSTSDLTATELEGKEVYVLEQRGAAYYLISESDPDKRVFVQVKMDALEDAMGQIEPEMQASEN